jgi:hypothetical protein
MRNNLLNEQKRIAMNKTWMRVVLLTLVLGLAACAPAASPNPAAAAPAETPTPAVTATARPTATPAPTADPYELDMDKFHNFPENYEYLLAHLEEFVQAPDPLTDRAAFDIWWDVELIPALGPMSERPLTADTADNSESIYGYAVSNFPSIPLIGKPNFFYFENDGTVYPVPCMNFSNSAYPGITKMTMCVALNDHVWASRANTNSLEMFQSPTDFRSATIMYDLHIFFTGVDWGRLEELVPALGKDYLDYDNWVVFGFGSIIFHRNY